MSRLDLTCYWLSLASIALFTYANTTSVAYGKSILIHLLTFIKVPNNVVARPIHTALIASTLCSFLLSTTHKVLPNLFAIPGSKDKYEPLPLDDLSASIRQPRVPPWQRLFHTHDGRVRVSVLATATTILIVRLELFRRISTATECMTSSIEVFLPLLLGLYDAYKFDHAVRLGGNDSGINSNTALWSTPDRYVLKNELRYIIPTIFTSIGAYILVLFLKPSNSSFICPIGSSQKLMVPTMQVICVILDLGLGVVVNEMLPHKDGSGLPPRRTTVLWSSTMVAVTLFWVLISFVLYFSRSELRSYIILWDVPSRGLFGIAAFWQGLLFSAIFISTLHSILCYGIVFMAVMSTIASMTTLTVKGLFFSEQPFPSRSTFTMTLAIALIFTGYCLLQKVTKHIHNTARKSSSTRKPALFVTVVLMFVSWLTRYLVQSHPIDLLVYDAEMQYRAYAYSLAPQVTFRAVCKYWTKYRRNVLQNVMLDTDVAFVDTLTSYTRPSCRQQSQELHFVPVINFEEH